MACVRWGERPREPGSGLEPCPLSKNRFHLNWFDQVRLTRTWTADGAEAPNAKLQTLHSGSVFWSVPTFWRCGNVVNLAMILPLLGERARVRANEVTGLGGSPSPGWFDWVGPILTGLDTPGPGARTRAFPGHTTPSAERTPCPHSSHIKHHSSLLMSKSPGRS